MDIQDLYERAKAYTPKVKGYEWAIGVLYQPSTNTSKEYVYLRYKYKDYRGEDASVTHLVLRFEDDGNICVPKVFRPEITVHPDELDDFLEYEVKRYT